ncbi:sensor histidine kinase [Clostridiaceae bacterium 35-E11]
MRNKLLRILLCSLTISIIATFNLPLFTEGFIVSLSTGILPFLLYLNRDISGLLLCLIISIVSPLFRYFLYLNSMMTKQAFLIVWPDSIFYLTYGIIFYLIYQKNKIHNVNRLIITAFICDFFGNLIEISIRIGFFNLTYGIVSKLLLIAGIRTFMLIVLIISSNYYQSFLINQDHEVRYRHLLEMASSFKSEIYFMHKNMDRIETVMQQSFQAYKIVLEKKSQHDLKSILLNLSKDVHEIKKDYIRVISGIEQTFPDLLEFTELTVKEIAQILTLNTKEHLLKNHKAISFECNVIGNAKVKSHFFLMSILGNLVQNAIEASKEKKMSAVSLKINAEEADVIIRVTDTGKGIEAEHMPHIFNPGFSTKYNSTTGDMNRGIGLTLVKSLVEEYFQGSLSVESELEKGTIFSIRIPKNLLEGEIS